MTVKTGGAWAGTFVTKDATGALATPTTGPAGALYVDGTANGASVTITGSNPYKWAVTLPSLTAGQRVDMYITATIATIATAAVVASEQADTALASEVKTDTAAILLDTGTDGVIVASIANDAITAAAIKADAITEIQNGLATPTNITAGTITTVTNLTNLPAITANWLTAAGIDATAVTELQSGLASEATLTAIKGAGWTNETLKKIVTDIAAISAGSGASAAEVWAYVSRTLTQAAASVTAAVSGSDLTGYCGDTLSFSLTGLGALTGYGKVYFSIKRDLADVDSASIVMIEKTAGLQYINGAAGTAGNGTLTIDDEAAGNITVTLKASETVKLDPGLYNYDVKVVRSAGTVSTLTQANFTWKSDVTKATT